MLYEDVSFWSMDPVEPAAEIPDQDDAPTPEEGDEYVVMEVLLPRRYSYQRETVAHRKRSADSELISCRNSNQILYTIL